ncbi:MAG: hypothetical protein HGB15_01560 [Chlorobaculum sp.]|nr:hypothetical protein [Chlorobaculum sp.]
MSNNSINIRDLFNGLQKQMEVQLNTNRENIMHPGTKGDSLENVWIEWLKKYMPNRYGIDKAIIIDSNGNLSDQIDLVIYDQQYTPFVFTQNGVHYIPSEGVYAVFEVKPDLQGSVSSEGSNINYIEYAGRKIESVRALKRTSANIIDRGELKHPRPLTKIIGGILTSVNSFSKKETIEKHLKNMIDIQSIDMGCVVEFGSFYIDYNGVEKKEIKDPDERIRDYYKNRTFNQITYSERETSLVTFFLQLSRYLQQAVGTVAAIDFNAYAINVGFKIDEEI